MPDFRTIFDPSDLSRDTLAQMALRPKERRVLMVEPTYFELRYAINPHMRDEKGKLHDVDVLLAREQWRGLRSVYERLGFEVEVVPAQADFPDMVFAANQSLPFLDEEGNRQVLISRMKNAERRGEIGALVGFYGAQGFESVLLPDLPNDWTWEGAGDFLWYPGRRLLVAGFGFRSEEAVLKRLPSWVEAPVIGLELVDERFYHLDVALSLLDESTALWVPEAFSEKSAELLKTLIPKLLPVSATEAVDALAANAHCPDQEHVLIDERAVETSAQLEAAGFEVIAVDTGEFLKAGGSVFCLKNMLP